MSAAEKPGDTVYDVIIIGAGISGINASYRVQTEIPGAKYAVLEARGGIGGTWDFFRYPGIRSDSDLHTFGFPWRPWVEQKAIADGASIRKYINETAQAEGIDKHVLFHHKVISSNWSSEQQMWSITCDANGEKKHFHTRFIIVGTGYYDYEEALPATIPGIANFKGTIIHPQFWPEDLDYENKRMVVIGSGATAVTLLPSLAEKAEHVTMLQRSPGYLISMPAIDPTSNWARNWLPSWFAHSLVRLKFLVLPWVFFLFCRRFPRLARAVLRKRTVDQLPKSIPHDPHFEPSYNPWEQRLCMCPDGDFFKALREGKTDVATGHIETCTEKGVVLKSGQELDCDILVTATGLKIQMAGGSAISVDGEPLNIGSKFLWKGMMLQDTPNVAFCIGYTNASWTLGADATALLTCRLINTMKKTGASVAVPRIPDTQQLKAAPTLNLNSTYVVKAVDKLPKAGDSGPWRPRANYFRDYWNAKFGNITTGLEFVRPVST